MKPEKKVRVALYIRVSTAEQGEKYGAKSQEREMLRWVDFHKYKVDKTRHIYRDIDYSGASEIKERGALPELFKAAERKEFDIVLVWKIDRFFRKTLYLLEAIEKLEQMGIGFISTTQPEVNTTTTTGKFMIGLLGIIAEMERNNILERTTAGKIAGAEAGRWVGAGHVPIGYDVDIETMKLAINEEEAKIVRKIFDWCANEGFTMYQIQDRLNAMKIPTKADKKIAELKKQKRFKKRKRSWNNRRWLWKKRKREC